MSLDYSYFRLPSVFSSSFSLQLFPCPVFCPLFFFAVAFGFISGCLRPLRLGVVSLVFCSLRLFSGPSGVLCFCL